MLCVSAFFFRAYAAPCRVFRRVVAQVGDVLLLDDGKLRMSVTAKHENAVDTVVEVSEDQSIRHVTCVSGRGSSDH